MTMRALIEMFSVVACVDPRQTHDDLDMSQSSPNIIESPSQDRGYCTWYLVFAYTSQSKVNSYSNYGKVCVRASNIENGLMSKLMDCGNPSLAFIVFSNVSNQYDTST